MDDRERILRYYDRLREEHGATVNALDWGSAGSQARRFEVLTAIGDLRGTTILDVGCGFSDLLTFLTSRGDRVRYTGVDLNPRTVDEARRRHPTAEFHAGDIVTLDLAPRSFDYVISSGIFYLRQADPYAFMHEAAARMFALARRGVAFNTLSARGGPPAEGEFRADPDRVLSMCFEITPLVALRHDYFPHDFTVYLRHQS